MKNRLHHIALGARDVAAVAGFYRDVFGLEEVATHQDDAGALRSVWLALAETCVLMVERTEDPPRDVHGVGAGAFLLAFSVDAAGRDAFEAEVVRRGGRIEDRSAYSSYARDPENNRIAVSVYPLPVR